MKKHILFLAVLVIACIGVFSAGAWAVNDDVLMDHFSDIQTMGNEVKADFNLLRAQFLNINLNDKNVAEGSNNATIKTGVTGNVVIGGVFYAVNATDNVAMTAAATQNYTTEVTCNYLITVDSGADFTVTKGSGTTLPAVPSGEVAISYFQVALSAGGSFISGTTDLSATSVNATFYDIMAVPNGTSAATAISASDLDLDEL